MTCNASGHSRRAASRGRAKPSRRGFTRLEGFTLLEVMAGVLVLGLLYTVLASAAMRGLRSEGTDRRRADAAMVADRQLAAIETELEAGQPLRDGRSESEQEPFKIQIEVLPVDVLTFLPPKLGRELARTQDPRARSVLHDERGQSRIRRINVIVEWDEAGEPDHVERSTYAYDKAAIEGFFPSSGSGEASKPADDSLDALREAAPPELQSLIPNATPQKKTRK
jgi:type II secretory pathway pseudopilin PulG